MEDLERAEKPEDILLSALQGQNATPEPEPEQEASVEPEAEAPEQEAPEPDSESEADLDEPMYVVKVDGEERRVPVSDLIQRYSLGEATQRRFNQANEERSAAAKARQEVEQYQQAFQAKQAELDQRLERVNEFLGRMGEEDLTPPDPAMKETDPLGYTEAVSAYMMKRDEREKAKQVKAQIEHEKSQRAAQQRQQYVAAEISEFKTRFKDFGDADEKRIGQWMAKRGHKPEEFAPIFHRTTLEAFHKAALYDELSTKESAAPKGKPVLKPGAVKSPQLGTHQKKQLERLKTSGGVDDAAKYLEGFLGS